MIDVSKIPQQQPAAPMQSYGGNQAGVTATPSAQVGRTDVPQSTSTQVSGGQAMPQQQQQGFNFPQEWGTASNVLTNFAEGMPTQLPQLWQQGGQLASQMAQTGMPVDVSGAYNAWQPLAQQQMEDFTKQAAEQAGMPGGMGRWGTPMMRQLAEQAGRMSTQFGMGQAQSQIGAEEAARQRQMGGIGQMYQFGAGGAGLAEASRNRGLQAAGMLPGLGQRYADLPMNVAQTMMGLGGEQQRQNILASNPAMSEWMRTLPENSPWLQYGMQGSQLPYMETPQQYQPSMLGQMLNAGVSGIGIAGQMGWNPFGANQGGGMTTTQQGQINPYWNTQGWG